MSILAKSRSTRVNQSGAEVTPLLFYTRFEDSIVGYSDDDISFLLPCFTLRCVSAVCSKG